MDDNKTLQDNSYNPLFPEFEHFVKKNRLLETAKGNLSAKLPRILGQGKSRAEGLELPPSPVERRLELTSLTVPPDLSLPREVKDEISAAKEWLTERFNELRNHEGQRRFASAVLKALGPPSGVKDNQFFVGRLVLIGDKAGQNWSWNLTPYYPFISKIPPDIEYVIKAHSAAEKMIEDSILPIGEFQERLELAWIIARQFSSSDHVLISDVARVFKVAAQNQRFWSNPSRRNFNDIPDGSFIANLINWKKKKSDYSQEDIFDFIPATLSQAHGSKTKVFYMPTNQEGTQVRPIIYLRRSKSKT